MLHGLLREASFTIPRDIAVNICFITPYPQTLHNLNKEINNIYQTEIQCFFKSFQESTRKIERERTKPISPLIVSGLVWVRMQARLCAQDIDMT